jgi:transposase
MKDGPSVRAAALRFGVSPTTAKKRFVRWEQASEPQ